MVIGISLISVLCLLHTYQLVSASPRITNRDADEMQCGRFGCVGGGKRELHHPSRLDRIEHKPMKEYLNKSSKMTKISVRKPCWRFGCGKRELRRFSITNNINKSQLDPRNHQLQPTITPKYQSIGRKSRSFRFGHKKTIGQRLTKNFSHKIKEGYSQYKGGSQSKRRCLRFACYIKKSMERAITSPSRKDFHDKFNNFLFHKRNFQEDDDTN